MDDSEKMGYMLAGPLSSSIAEWLISKYTTDNLDKLILVGRDSKLMFLFIRKFKPAVNVSYFQTSRLAMRENESVHFKKAFIVEMHSNKNIGLFDLSWSENTFRLITGMFPEQDFKFYNLISTQRKSQSISKHFWEFKFGMLNPKKRLILNMRDVVETLLTDSFPSLVSHNKSTNIQKFDSNAYAFTKEIHTGAIKFFEQYKYSESETNTAAFMLLQKMWRNPPNYVKRALKNNVHDVDPEKGIEKIFTIDRFNEFDLLRPVLWPGLSEGNGILRTCLYAQYYLNRLIKYIKFFF